MARRRGIESEHVGKTKFYRFEKGTVMVDTYTKFILTVIAICLIWISVRDTAPSVYAAQGTIDVNIREIGGGYIGYGGPLPVREE